MTNDNIIPFNPLDKRHLGESIAQAMLCQSALPLANLNRFNGAGIYAIYYKGSFPGYEAIAMRNTREKYTAPIYVGRAVPKGSRKGGDLSADPGPALFLRLRDHKRSIVEATNLEVEDFACRYLAVEDIWIPLGETLLISRFTPVWNKLIDGFGNHTPGRGRFAGQKPRWDVLHPGRSWAANCRPREETAEQIICEVRDYLRNNPPPDDPLLPTP